MTDHVSIFQSGREASEFSVNPLCPLTESKEGSIRAYLTPPHSYQKACVDMS